MRIPVACILCLAFVCVPGITAVAAQQTSAVPRPLTNQDVVQMARAKFDDATIVKTIETHTASFDLSVEALLRLKDAGVSLSVIQAMLVDQWREKDIQRTAGNNGGGACEAFTVF
jgi:hypothetical protein